MRALRDAIAILCAFAGLALIGATGRALAQLKLPPAESPCT